MDSGDTRIEKHSLQRIRVFYALLLVVFSVFALRLFYLQVIKHNDYKQAARNDQFREYEVDADRGTIYAELNGKTVPLVVNQKLFTVYADPSIIKKPTETAAKVAPVIKENESAVRELLELKERRYVILKKRVDAGTVKKLLSLKLPGVGAQERNYRAYPQGTLASQVLGFVNDDGVGKYGLEQALNPVLAGKKGQLKAVTDVHGVPLASNQDNILVEPVAGQGVTLTLDIGMQTQVEQIIKKAQENFKAKTVSAVVLETQTGAVKAMANYPTFDPAAYDKVEDGEVFQNASVTEPIEPGSIAKVISVAAALNENAVEPFTPYNDPGHYTFDGARIINVAEGYGSGAQTVSTMLNKSLNTGAVWVMMQMGGKGQTKITPKARETLYKYYHDNYRLDQETGIEQGYEEVGTLIPPEDKDNGIAITYANMAFGQAFTASALQMGAALSAIVNGGNYYQPHLVASKALESGEIEKTPLKILRKNVVSERTSKDMIHLLDINTKDHIARWPYMKFQDGYVVGGKTGTAQIPSPTGGYEDALFHGTFMGFVGGDTPEYTIVVYAYEPKNYTGHAGSQVGQPIFADIAHMLIDNYGVTPKSK